MIYKPPFSAALILPALAALAGCGSDPSAARSTLPGDNTPTNRGGSSSSGGSGNSGGSNSSGSDSSGGSDSTALGGSSGSSGGTSQQLSNPQCSDTCALDEQQAPPSTVQAEAFAVLDAHCGSCHAGGFELGEFGYLLDPDALVDGGLIVPGSASESTLVLRVLGGEMPPPQSNQPPPSREDLDVVSDWINTLTADVEICGPYFSDYRVALQPLTQLGDSENRPFLRYLSLDYLPDCPRGITRHRAAVSRALNSLSNQPEITPTASTGRYLQIDIRDYGWDRPLDVDGDGTAEFDSAWAAIVEGVGPYGLQLTGSHVDQLSAQSMPIVRADALIAYAMSGDLYYALVDAPQTAVELRASFGLDEQSAISAGTVKRGNTLLPDSPWLQRFELGAGEHPLWESTNFEAASFDIVSNDLFRPFTDPLQAMFTLPNGLPAYFSAGAGGQRVAAVTGHFDNDTVPNGIACEQCHLSGVLPFTDQAQPLVTSAALAWPATFRNADFAQAYQPQAQWAPMLEADSLLVTDTLLAAGFSPDNNPAVSVAFEFAQQPIDLRRAATELRVSEPRLQASLSDLPAALGNLAAGGQVSRATFTAAYADSICVLHAGADNGPVCP